MARYLRDPSGDDPLPRSFRHRGLHHGPGSTQNQARPGLEIRRAGLHGCVDPAAGSLPSLTQGHPPPPVPTHPLPPAREPGSCRLKGLERRQGTRSAEGTVGPALFTRPRRTHASSPGCPTALLPATHGTAAGARAASCQVSPSMCRVPGTVWGHETSQGTSPIS